MSKQSEIHKDTRRPHFRTPEEIADQRVNEFNEGYVLGQTVTLQSGRTVHTIGPAVVKTAVYAAVPVAGGGFVPLSSLQSRGAINATPFDDLDDE